MNHLLIPAAFQHFPYYVKLENNLQHAGPVVVVEVSRNARFIKFSAECSRFSSFVVRTKKNYL